MSDPQQLESEIREYLKKEPNLRGADKLTYLKAIFNKHLEFNNLEHTINKGDLFDVISGAKQFYTSFHLPIRVSGRKLDSAETVHVAMLESFISYLNRMHLLKKLVKFDFT